MPICYNIQPLPPPKKHIFFNIYVCMCLLLYIIYMCYSIYGCVLTYQKLPFLGAFLTFQNHTQKLRALLNRNSACQMLCSVTQILFSPQDYPPSCWVFYKQMVLSIILFSCSGSHSSCEWQLYIQWLMKVDRRKNSLHSDSRKHRADVRF